MELHEAINAVLKDRPSGMTSRELADEINRRDLYVRPSDGRPVAAGQISARVGNKTYSDRYHKDQHGRISLANPSGITGSSWDIAIGDPLGREERMRRFGGAKYGGIEPSASSPNVFLYSDPAKGQAFGYTYDGWTANRDVFLYTGEGPTGDQPMTHGNRAILEHRKHGRSLRLFIADGEIPGTAQRNQRYVGEFAVDPQNPYSLVDALDEEQEERTVFVFRLLPVGAVLRRQVDQSTYADIQAGAKASLVGVEENQADIFPVAPTQGTTAKRREAELVDRYMSWVGPAQRFRRWKLTPRGELRPLLTDIYSETDNVLFEAKGTAVRASIRSAIGQLFDYQRHIDREGLSLAVLLPHRPSQDLEELILGLGIAVVYESPGDGFAQIRPG
jgi:5-methylcytosine-specific restriction protein A